MVVSTRSIAARARVPELPRELWLKILVCKHEDWERSWLASLSDEEFEMYGGESPVSPEEMAEMDYEQLVQYRTT